MFYFLFLQVLRCFSSLGSPAFAYSSRSVFPHSDICGSRLICSSPQLFAACHVLPRRHVPRHPPYALCSLIFLLVYLSLHTSQKNSMTSTRPNRFASPAFRLTLLFLRFRINHLAFIFVLPFVLCFSFSMQLSIFGCSTYFRNSVHILILGRHRSAHAAFAAWWAHAELPTKRLM